MSNRKNETHGSSPWGKTSRFTYKNAAKRNPVISKEEKERFLTNGTLPKFKSTQRSEKWLQKKCSNVETDLLREAITILNKVRDEFGNEGGFIEAAYGKRININRASEVIHNYLVEHGIDGMMSVCFTSEMDCSGKMQWTGPMTKYNQPERRNYSMWVKTTSDNIYFRETGILNLTNHEIGTHFFRSVNDGLQPWFSNRTKFGLCPYKAQALKDTEEGLAALNTTFEAKVKYIWGPAMLYYTACMSLEMNFKDLFEHLGKYVLDPEIRWKYVVRVKRGRTPAQLGGNGKDQCYFRGVVHILRNIDSINFLLLYAGKITVDDQSRVQRLARLGCIKTPYFLKDMNGYRRYMRNLSKINGISKPRPLPRGPELKLNLPKTPRHDKFSNHNNNGNNQPVKKSQKAQMLEARQRIMSSHLLSKARRRLLDDTISDDKLFLVGETLTIEHESDDADDVPPEGEKEFCSFDAKLCQSSLSEVEKEISPNPPLQKVFLTGRRRSDSFCSPTLRTPSREERRDSQHEGDSGRSEKMGCCVAETFCILSKKPERHRLADYSGSTTAREKERKAIGDIFSNNSEPLENRVHAIIPSCASPVDQSPTVPPNAAFQLIREIPYTPNPSHFDIMRPSLVNNTPPSERKLPRQRSTQCATPTPSSPGGVKRKGSSSSRASSSTTTTVSVTSKRSLRKNLALFFEDLIPFSKSRRKRVLPLP